MTHSLTTHQGPNSPDATTDSLPSGVGATILIEFDDCDECGWSYPVNLLWRILARGLVCGRCVDEIRLEEAS